MPNIEAYLAKVFKNNSLNSGDHRIKLHPYLLKFKREAGTSRGTMHQHKIWIVEMRKGERIGYGECAPLQGLSPELDDSFEERIIKVCKRFNDLGWAAIRDEMEMLPSLNFALETALLDLENGSAKEPFKIKLPLRIKINGLVWMGNRSFMEEQARSLLSRGFTCIKIKIGALDWDEELSFLVWLRSVGGDRLQIRVDANGAFNNDVNKRMDALSALNIHSIEQPIAINQHERMAELCKKNIVPVGLDEELLAIRSSKEKRQLLEYIKPKYLILKPGLLGGFSQSMEWIKLAKELGISWWITSALESNIGLNAISRFASLFDNNQPSGLGTGSLYTNNFKSPLKIKGEYLTNEGEDWEINLE